MNENLPFLPLTGIRVLEFSHAALGPTCGMVLGDLGADVIKIEPTPDGDPTRQLKGFGLGYFPYLNRNKRSLVVDAKSADGQSIIHQLLQSADVVIENFGPGTMERLNLGYDQLSDQYPRLIYCALKGFLPGPYAKRMALDEVVQMMSGLAYMTGRPGDPLRAGASITDLMTGVYGALGVVLALQQREHTGKGQFVHTALFETTAFIMGHHMAYAAQTTEPVPPMPSRVSAWAVYHQFETCDGQRVFVGVTSDKQWSRFCEAFERPDLLADASLRTNNQRIDARNWLLDDLRAMFGRMTCDDIIARCEDARLPFAPIARPEDLFADPQLNAGGSLLETTFPDGTQTKLPRLPLRFGDDALPLRRDPPRTGQHTREILRELGRSTAQIDALAINQIIVLEE